MSDDDELNKALRAMKIEEGGQNHRKDNDDNVKVETPKTPHTPSRKSYPSEAPPVVVSTPPDKVVKTPEDQQIKYEQNQYATPDQQQYDEDKELEEFTKLFKGKLSIAEPTVPKDQTLILLSPLSYHHVFSRFWVPKRYVSSIVERPERIKACSLGIGAAMNELPSKFILESSTKRSKLTAPHVSKVHGEDWGKRLYDLCSKSSAKLMQKELEVPEEWHSGDIYLCEGTIDAIEGNLAAIERAVDDLFTDNRPDRAFISLRPPGHHSHPCEPSGFCLVNNVHVAIQYAAEKFGVTHAVILDFDLHHGDGSQDITWEQNFGHTNTPRIGYFSLHDINSFPTEKGFAEQEYVKNASTCCMAHDMAVWNVHLQTYETDQQFDSQYENEYSVLFNKARQFLKGSSKPMVFLSAGFDASEYEMETMQRHGVHVPTRFYNRFTRDALRLAQDFNCKTLSLLEGGYSDAALSTGLFGHLTGLADSPWKWQVDAACAKEFERGCKHRYAIGAAGTWVTESVLLGRSLWPKEAFKTPRATPARSGVSTPHLLATTGHNRVLPSAGGGVSNLDVLATPSRVLRDRSKHGPPSVRR